MKCPNCGAGVDVGVERCPNCGQAQYPRPRRKVIWPTILLIIVLVMCGVCGGCLLYIGYGLSHAYPSSESPTTTPAVKR